MTYNEHWQRAREEVVLFSRRLLAEHLVYYTAGNVSRRVDGDPGLYAVTPTSTPYDTLRPEDVVIATVDGEVVDGALRPTVEFPLHSALYRRRPEVGGVVHTHSPAAMTMAAFGWTLPPILTGFAEAAGGAVVTARYARPGSDELADAVADALADRGACFLRHHGLLAIGPTLARAYNAASVTEGAAEVYLRARQFDADVPELPAGEAGWLHEEWAAHWEKRP
jgi:L-ribulose-5-phosphate 4-epimerase